LLNADRVFFRMSGHPVYHWLQQRGVSVFCFDLVYATPRIAYHDVYEFIAAAVLKEAHRAGRAVYALPGNPFTLEHTSCLIQRWAEAAKIDLRVIPGMSFLEIVYAELRLNPVGIQICNAVDFQLPELALSQHRGLLIGGLLAPVEPAPSSGRANVGFVSRWLGHKFPPSHPISLVWTAGMPDYVTYTKHFPLKEFDRECECLRDVPCASVYVPPLMSSHGSANESIGDA
jgi:uncharacterized protein YabN with tetrapyrrole methylase and pyrophosphatase domain